MAIQTEFNYSCSPYNTHHIPRLYLPSSSLSLSCTLDRFACLLLMKLKLSTRSGPKPRPQQQAATTRTSNA